jgi:hypothetical protein
MKYFIAMSMTLLLAAGALFAQGFAGGNGGATATTIMLKTDKGLFALRSGVLIKSDVATLKQNAELQLLGPAPTMPADRTDQAAMQDFRTQMMKRMAPALMFATNDSLIVIIGDGFWRISQDTLTAAANTSLAAPVDPNAPVGRPMAEPAPGYLLDGTTLYLMRAKEEMAINITDGTILARVALPTELQPVAMPGGRRPGGGGGGGAAPGGPPVGG